MSGPGYRAATTANELTISILVLQIHSFQSFNTTQKPIARIESTLITLNQHLEKVLEVLKSEEVKQELHESLHNHNKGVLPSSSAAALANATIDRLHEIEQLLEPGHLVLADHFLGTQGSFLNEQ